MDSQFELLGLVCFGTRRFLRSGTTSQLAFAENSDVIRPLQVSLSPRDSRKRDRRRPSRKNGWSWRGSLAANRTTESRVQQHVVSTTSAKRYCSRASQPRCLSTVLRTRSSQPRSRSLLDG